MHIRAVFHFSLFVGAKYLLPWFELPSFGPGKISFALVFSANNKDYKRAKNISPIQKSFLPLYQRSLLRCEVAELIDHLVDLLFFEGRGEKQLPVPLRS